MVAGARGRAGKPATPDARRKSAAGTAQNYADEALQDAVDELNDTAAGLDGGGESAGPALPDGLLKRR